MIIRCLVFCIFFAVTACSFAQSDTALITALLKNIEASQIKEDGEFYKGTFPGFREGAGFPHNYQPDNNIFFTAITAFTLKKLLPNLDTGNKAKAQQIVQNTAGAYRHYQKDPGKPFYSFWPANAPILPHSFFISRLDKLLAQGDDADDSVMILMAMENDEQNSNILKERLIQLSNLKKRKINSTFKKYRNIPAYSTYLGEKMHPDFDFAVQCNLLYFVFENNMQLVKEDSATISLLAAMLKNREYIKRPVYIAPNYISPAILIYHISRLMGAFKIAALDAYKEQLIADAYHLLSKATNTMDCIILRTSLLRLGANVPELAISSITDFEKTNQDQFVFFQARAAFAQPTPVKQIFLHFKYLIYYFYCDAYNKALWLEYLVLRNAQQHLTGK